jgi:VWFA-related protein
VTDAKGSITKTLKAEDFVVYEDGVRQKIAHFAATESPFTLLLLLDLSGSARDEIDLIKQAARRFLAELRTDDRVGVIIFSGEVELIADFTEPRADVEAAIQGVATPSAEDGFKFHEKTGTAFYDALFLAVEDSPLKKVEGRKAIVCMSDGVDSISKMKYNEVGKLIEQSQASVYFLELNTESETLAGLLKPLNDPEFINFSKSQMDRYFDAHDPESPNRFRERKLLPPDLIREINRRLYEGARQELRQLADRTGGRVYPVKTTAQLSGVYKQVADDLRSQYSIGYYPINDKHDGRWRNIKVEVKTGGTVRARTGYWSPGSKN